MLRILEIRILATFYVLLVKQRRSPQRSFLLQMAGLLEICVGLTIPVACYALYDSAWHYSNRWRSVHKISLPSIAQKIAHRGSRSEGLPENTLAAFRSALSAGADVLECDIWLTADKRVVVHHDESLKRMTGVDQKIKETNYADMPRIIFEIANSKFSKEELEHIPLLEEVLQLLPADRALIIEFKQDSWELIETVHKLLIEMNKLKSVFWFSLDEKINKKLRKCDASVPTITSIQGMLTVLFLYYLGILPFVDIQDAVFGITVEEV